MAEAVYKESFSDLKELENKIGRKTPESLLNWMRDAADCEDSWRSDVVERRQHGSSISDKINYLRQEMRWLRSADVKILSQLLAVHEGIEAMRWLMEDHGTLASRGSSSAGSLSSLVTVEEFEPWMSNFRESPSPTCPLDLTEIREEKSEDQQPPQTNDSDSDHKRFPETPVPEFTEAGSHRPSYTDFEVSCSTHDMLQVTSTNCANSLACASLEKSQQVARSQSLKTNANTIRMALHRFNRKRQLRSDSFINTSQSEEDQTNHQIQKKGKACWNIMVEEDEKTHNTGGLLGYDAQWHWVESDDDVTFL